MNKKVEEKVKSKPDINEKTKAIAIAGKKLTPQK